MSADPVLSVLFLWHQHQPFYKDSVTDRYQLPWARLHATKDYYDMVALLDEFPKIKANFNLVPSLLVQLDDYASGKAKDRFVELSVKPASELTEDDRLFLLTNFFMAHWERKIDPFPRYQELLEKRGRRSNHEDLKRTQLYFKDQDWRDLQVWFNLSWMDPLWAEKDSFVRSLFEKGKGFSEEEKIKLVAKQAEICGLVSGKHKELADRGQIEITATPFYHPILPLLCDTDAAAVAMPGIQRPEHRFRHPEDARRQIELALEDHERRFGRRPRGMWPSEGSVSPETAGLFADLGVQWIATDEAVLANSVGPDFQRDDLYRPYRLELNGKSLHIFFRDHELSDAIGFVYAGWKAAEAADDFVRRLHLIRDRLKARGESAKSHVVPVILDGENCWEYYDQDGLPFLRALYRRLSDDPLIETVTGSEYLQAHSDAAGRLESLWSGSWINANFSIWIGHSEDNRAWDLLYQTRQFLVSFLEKNPAAAESPEGRMAWESIRIAEGSDWCWWYGNDHSSANDETFDQLFRKNLMNVYTLLERPVPKDLHTPIKKPKTRTNALQDPIDFITPKIDGRVSSYYEWHGAGRYEVHGGETGTMHRVENLITDHYYGFDLDHLYFRFDFAKSTDLAESLVIKISFTDPSNIDLTIRFNASKEPTVMLRKGQDEPKPWPAIRAVYQKVLELAVPLKDLKSDPTTGFQYLIAVEQRGQEVERWPSDRLIALPFPKPDLFADAWQA